MSQRWDNQTPAVIEPALLQPNAHKNSCNSRKSIALICAGIFVLAFVIRVGLLFATRSYLSIEHSELVNVATSLAQGRGFANAFGNTGPTAHMSPLYPLLLSFVYRWFGTGATGEIAQEILSCFLAALTWALIPLLAEICQLDRRVGVGAALAGALLTINRWAETKGSSEAAMAGLACLLLVTCYMRLWYTRDFSVRAGVFAGILSGLALLVSASLGSIVFGLLLTGYFLFRRTVAKVYLIFGLVAVAAVLVTLLPWALRNYFVLGHMVWTRSNFPLELMVSNNDYARARLQDNDQSGLRYHPYMSAEQRQAVTRMGEIAYQQKVKGDAFRWIISHPRTFAWLTLQRIYYVWFPQMKRLPQSIALAFLTLASVPALVGLVKRRQLIGYGLLTIWVTYPLVYYVVQTHPRYVYPMQWTMYLLTGESVGLAYLAWTGQRRRSFFLSQTERI